jgi:hypothetical protein
MYYAVKPLKMSLINTAHIKLPKQKKIFLEEIYRCQPGRLRPQAYTGRTTEELGFDFGRAEIFLGIADFLDSA